VIVDGTTIYSKWETGRFPQLEEVASAVESRLQKTG
jgi:hypothetical protein